MPALIGAPRDSKRLICRRSPVQEAAYSLEASDSSSFAERTGDDWKPESARGNLGGEID